MRIQRDVVVSQAECIILQKGDTITVLDGELPIITDPMTAISIQEAPKS